MDTASGLEEMFWMGILVIRFACLVTVVCRDSGRMAFEHAEEEQVEDVPFVELILLVDPEEHGGQDCVAPRRRLTTLSSGATGMPYHTTQERRESTIPCPPQPNSGDMVHTQTFQGMLTHLVSSQLKAQELQERELAAREGELQVGVEGGENLAALLR